MSARSIKKFEQALRKLSATAAVEIAKRVAPEITQASEDTFRRSEDPYGIAWDPGADGRTVTLVETGAMSRFLRYVPAGRKVRVALGVPYAKYQIGRRPVFPRRGAPLPKAYAEAIEKTAEEIIKEKLKL